MCVSCLGRCPRLTYWRPVGPGFIVQTLFFHIESVRVSIFPQNYGGFTIHQIQTAFAITNWDMACGTDPKCRIYVEELMDDEAEDEVPTLLAAVWREVLKSSGIYVSWNPIHGNPKILRANWLIATVLECGR